jgi:hypothetical protein
MEKGPSTNNRQRFESGVPIGIKHGTALLANLKNFVDFLWLIAANANVEGGCSVFIKVSWQRTLNCRVPDPWAVTQTFFDAVFGHQSGRFVHRSYGAVLCWTYLVLVQWSKGFAFSLGLRLTGFLYSNQPA